MLDRQFGHRPITRQLESRRSLAEVVEASDRDAGQPARPLDEETPRRSVDERGRARAAVLVGQAHAGLQSLGEVVPGELPPRHDPLDDDQPLAHRLAQDPRRPATRDAPAGVLGEAAPIGVDAGVARPPVGEVIRLADERPDVLPRREDHTGGFDHSSPTSDWIRPTRSEMKRCRSDEDTTTATVAPSPATAKASIGPMPARPWKSRETPRASMSSAPFSCARRTATSSLVPGAGRIAEGSPRRSTRARPGARPPG